MFRKMEEEQHPLGSTYSNLVDNCINKVTKYWVGFIKLHLQHSERDNLVLLKEKGLCHDYEECKEGDR